MTSSGLPDPVTEIMMTALHTVRGANYWAPKAVTRMDLSIGAYEHISSAEAPGFTEQLLRAMPGLVEHRCSVGERGGFVTRLRRGTYAAHIVEHVALELQSMVGHDVSFGRTRGSGAPGDYTLVFDHLHEGVGVRAAALALETVQRAFAGTLEAVECAVAELRSVASSASDPAPERRVLCGITGSSLRAETRRQLARLLPREDGAVVDVSPGFILQAGLPYTRSGMAIVLDSAIRDVPPRFREPERASRLVSVLAAAVPAGGVLVCPAAEREVRALAREAGCSVALFDTAESGSGTKDLDDALAWASVAGGRIVIEHRSGATEHAGIERDAPLAAQLAGQLAGQLARSTHESLTHTDLAMPVTDG